MMYQTPPDANDEHVHLVELDDNGDGVTDEAGEPMHVHEIYTGQCEPFEEGDYISEHSGEMEPVDESDDEEEDPESDEDGDEEDMGGPELASEEVQTAVGRVMLGEDPRAVARNLLFG